MRFIKLNKNSETSFENIIVLIFVLFLIIVSVHRYRSMAGYAKTAAYKEDVKEINVALIMYKVKYGKFPRNLSVLVRDLII